MMKINNHIRYLLTLLLILLTLILLGSINVYAQTTGDLSQVISEAKQELSDLLPSSTHSISTTSFSEIIKQNIKNFIYYFINYAIPFLFVFLLLFLLAKHEDKKEISKPLFLILIIMAFLTTLFFHSVLLLLALVSTPVLVIIGLHRLFRGITGSIIGFLVTIVILVGVLTIDSLKELLSSPAYFILLFILLIIIFILSIKIGKGLSQSKEAKQLMNSIKELSYLIKKPKNIEELEEHINKTTKHFYEFAKDLNEKIGTLENALFNPQNQQNNQNAINVENLIQEIRTSYEQLQEYYNNILKYINDIKSNINIYDEAIRPQISNFLNRKERELFEIKNNVDLRYNRIFASPQAKQIINSILTNQISQNIREQLRSIREQYNKLIAIFEDVIEKCKALTSKILHIELDPNNYNNLLTSIDDLIKEAKNLLKTLNKVQEFNNEYEKILKDLNNLKPSIDKIPNQNERAMYHQQVNNIENIIKAYHQAFHNYYNQYQTINNLISHLQSIRDNMEELKEQIDELNYYYEKFKNNQQKSEERIRAGKKIMGFYGNIKQIVGKIYKSISTIPTPTIPTSHINTCDLFNAIERLKTKLLTVIQQLYGNIKSQYREVKGYLDNLPRQGRNYGQQNRQRNNRGRNRNTKRHGR